MTAKNKIEESKFRDVLNAVKRGEEDAKIKLAMLAFSGIIVNEEEVKKLEQQVKKGDTEAMWKLGLCKDFGMGTKLNKRIAESLYEESSFGGNPTGIILSMYGIELKHHDEDESDDDDEEEEEDKTCNACFFWYYC